MDVCVAPSTTYETEGFAPGVRRTSETFRTKVAPLETAASASAWQAWGWPIASGPGAAQHRAARVGFVEEAARAAEEAVELVEAALQRMGLAITQMPFAEHPGGVTG